MAIKVLFPAGSNSVSVSGLFQWDYGRVLEIESADIGSEIMEVHFSCESLPEAIVRPCSFSNGVGTVTIPDECLEQTATIRAWIYRVVGTEGYTIKTITIPITTRTRPSVKREIPQGFSDKYTELITEVNEAVENLESGNVTAKNATNAANASYAAVAGSAKSAEYSSSAGNAASASRPSSGGSFITADNNFGKDKYTTYSGETTLGGVYMVIDPTYGNAVAIIDTKAEFSTVYYAQKPDGSGTHVPFRIKATTNADGFVTLNRQWYNGSSWTEISGSGLLHRAINTY